MSVGRRNDISKAKETNDTTFLQLTICATLNFEVSMTMSDSYIGVWTFLSSRFPCFEYCQGHNTWHLGLCISCRTLSHVVKAKAENICRLVTRNDYTV